ncbi:MAG: hypothetical protein JHC84_19160 [Solirubrobacteraceae bacterium]|nr:hypothetical protein [Solirubrobacteraceae bacterium]
MLRVPAVVAALAILAAVPAAADGATAKKPRCKKGQVAWKLEGRTRCVKAVKVTLPRKPARRSQLAVTRLLERATASKPKLPATELTPAMRTLLRRPSVVAAAAQAEALARTRATASRVTPRASQTLTGPAFSETAGSATMTGTTSATLSDTGQVAIELGLRLAQGGASTEMKVGVELSPDASLTSLCPDETGKVVVERTTGGSLTTLVRKGGNVESAETVRSRTTTRSVGQVGADGRLDTVTSSATTTTTIARRGLQIGITTRELVTGPHGAPGKSTGTPSVSATVKGDGLSGADARAVEASIATKAAADATDAKIEKGMSDVGRNQLNEASKNWESLENNGSNACLKVAWSPGPGTLLKTGQTKTVKGRAVARNGGKSVAATWTVVSVAPGKFTGGGAAGPGGQTFTATGGKRSSTGDTVLASVVVASVAGRVREPWVGKDQPSFAFELDDRPTGQFATHDATGWLNVKTTLKLVPASNPARFESGPVSLSWQQVTATSKIPPCSYISPLGGGTMTVTAVQTGEQLTVTMDFTKDSSVSWTVSCPSDDGPPAEVAGQAGVSVLAMRPLTFTVPMAGGVQPIAGDVLLGTDGFRSNGTVTVTPVGG